MKKDYLSLIVDLHNKLYNETRYKLEVNELAAKPRINTWQDFRSDVELCTKCILSKTRTNVVFGEGSVNADLMIIGEAPGGDEDKQGKPFVGRAGQLLSKMLEAIDLTREDVFICNILKCRPPNNRNPKADEIEMCTPYLDKQIKTIKPSFIFTLGNFATKYLLDTKTGITKLRGKPVEWRDGIIVIPTYHPSALLRNPNLKRGSWEDLKLLRKLLDERK